MLANPQIRRRLVVLALLGVFVLPVSVWFYHKQPNPFSAQASVSASVTIDNPSALQNILPDSSYNYTAARVNDYMARAFPAVKTVHIVSPITTSDGTYKFQAQFLPGGGLHVISVRVVNYDSVISTAVYVDDVLVPSAAPVSSGGVTYSGFDSLVTAGFSSYQTQALQRAFAKFDPRASVLIDTSTVESGTDPSNSSYQFDVTVGGKTYSATATTVGLTDVRLQLFRQGGGTAVFDSGVVSSQT
jgi:hypothetical protein